MYGKSAIITRDTLVNGLFTSVLTPNENKIDGYILFVHGGPGNHSAYFQRLIEKEDVYQNPRIGWIFYDQRGCGRSEKVDSVSLLSHQKNLVDLSSLLDHYKNIGTKIIGVFGHSYGVRLAYETLINRLDLPYHHLIMAGRSAYKILPACRLVAIDLLIIKNDQPKDYEDLIEVLSQSDKPLWKHAELIRSKLKNVAKRKDFYWANKDRRSQYEKIIEEVAINENNDIFWQVRSTFDQGPQNEIYDPKLLKQKVLWINGAHDFLMGGETVLPEQKDYVVTFNGSAHYPHIEEPKRFMAEIEKFIVANKK